MTDMIDKIVKLYRAMSREARHLTVVIITAAIVITTMSLMVTPASAMSRSGDEEIPGITMTGEETAPEDGDFEHVQEEETAEPNEETVPEELTEAPEDTAQPEEPEETVLPEEPLSTEETEEPEETEIPEETEEEPAEEELQDEEELQEETEESDPEADVETAADWEAMFKDIELTGVWADDLLEIAESQVGYEESTANFILDEDDVKRGYTRYGAWHGNPYAKWDTLFIQFSMYYAGITSFDMPYETDCEDWAEALREKEMFFETETYLPVKGDLVFADTDEDGEADHAGLIEAVKINEAGEPVDIVVIEGDMNNAVEENTYEYHNPLILGYGKLPENPALEEAEETEPEEALPVYTLTGQANRIDVTVEYEEGAFPEGTTMEVKTVADRNVISAINETVSEENKEVVRVQAVDIIFRDAQGNEIEPAKPVRVTMKSRSVPAKATEKPTVVHVDSQEGPKVIESGTPYDEPADTKQAVTFEAGSFSVYAMVYTIETYYTSYDGNTYKITLGYTADANIPEGAELDVKEILPEDEDYEKYLEASAEQLGLKGSALTYGRFFDIRIMNGEEKIEPSDTVSVTIELDEMPETDDISILHFKEDSIETIASFTADSGSLSFETDSFSVYSVISSGATSDLDGKTFAMINRYTNNAIQADHIQSNTRLAAAKTGTKEQDGTQYITADEDITMWTFTSAGSGTYYIQADDGTYLNINGNTVTTSGTPQSLHVTAGTGNRNGRIRIRNDAGMSVNNLSGTTANGFGARNDNNNNEWFTLFEMVSLNPEYAAEKISVQDIEDAQRIILYKSVYNEVTEKYEDYVIDGEGNLVRAFDKGDQLVGRSAVSPVWTVIMHRDAQTGELNGYYDFYNEKTGMYLSPRSNGTLVEPNLRGVTLNGRRDGGYISTIEAWDTDAWAWYGLEYAENEGGDYELKSGTGEHSQEISFAAYITPDPDELHPVKTVDSVSAGITIHMFNYPNRNTIASVTGSDGYAQGVLPAPHASNTLNSDGYPTFKNGTSNGSKLFDPGNSYYKGDGNKLFLESVYNSTGYYEYNAFNNFAHYDKTTGNFTVYQETGTPSNDNKFYFQRGNFFPYNNLDPTRKATNRNLYDGEGDPLDVFDPTDGGPLYMVNSPDFYFGMTVEATFMQPKNGTEKEGPVIYEFNGDDDLWIYIDGVLILDIGGVHDAFAGSINFATGEITGGNGGAGKARTIKEAFKNAGVFPDGTAWDDSKADQYFKGDTFVDYGSHTFKMFYMEHGAGASNLEMRFNLPVIEKGRFTVEKVLDGTTQQKFANVYFAYQAFKKVGDIDVPLTSANYEGTTNPVRFYDSVVINGKTYTNVFYLKPGEAATFPEMAEDELYYVQELGIGTDYYDEVIVNDVKIDGQDATEVDGIYPTSVATVGNRARVTYSNHCSEKNLNELRITKRLAQGVVDDGSTFEFRVLLENANGVLAPYSTGAYYIQNDDGDYFYYVNGVLTNNGKTPVVASVAGNNGTIAGIPADYTVVIKDLLAETDFYVEEIRLPAGWELESKEVVEDTSDPSEMHGISFAGDDIVADGQIRLDTAAKEVFTNKGTKRLLVNKKWESGDFVTKHGDIQVALFKNEGELLTLVEGTVKTISAPSESVEYQVSSLDKFVVREVITNGDTVTPVNEGGAIAVSGETTKVGADSTDVYIASYEQGEVKTEDEEGNPIIPVRTDTITNKMPVLTVNKTDPDGHPLEEAVFRLLKSDKKTPVTGYESITSTTEDIGNLLKEIRLPMGTYYLEEIEAPSGYNPLEAMLEIDVKENGTITMAEEDTGQQDPKSYEDRTADDAYTYTFRIINNPGVTLPSTGGPGTRLFSLLGGLLVLLAGAALLRRRG